MKPHRYSSYQMTNEEYIDIAESESVPVATTTATPAPVVGPQIGPSAAPGPEDDDTPAYPPLEEDDDGDDPGPVGQGQSVCALHSPWVGVPASRRNHTSCL